MREKKIPQLKQKMKPQFYFVDCEGKHTECVKVHSGSPLYDVVPFIVTLPSIIVSVLMLPFCFICFLPLNVVVMVKHNDERPCSLYLVFLMAAFIVSGFILLLQVFTALTFSLPFLLIWPFRFLENLQLLDSVYFKPRLHHEHFLKDVWNCHSGMYLRQKSECLTSLPAMICLMPVVKWYTINPLLRKLSFIDVNQISCTMKCKDDRELYNLSKEILSKKHISEDVAKMIDRTIFMGYYPQNEYGHTIGIQMGMYGHINMLVWTEYVKHQSVVNRVFLSCVNPYHFVTGYVEVSIKDKKIAHPMRILTDTRSRYCMEKIRGIDETFACTFASSHKILKTLRHEKGVTC
jgi:hypothetical protein